MSIHDVFDLFINIDSPSSRVNLSNIYVLSFLFQTSLLHYTHIHDDANMT